MADDDESVLLAVAADRDGAASGQGAGGEGGAPIRRARAEAAAMSTWHLADLARRYGVIEVRPGYYAGTVRLTVACAGQRYSVDGGLDECIRGLETLFHDPRGPSDPTARKEGGRG